jgi:hypothetical protein
MTDVAQAAEAAQGVERIDEAQQRRSIAVSEEAALKISATEPSQVLLFDLN